MLVDQYYTRGRRRHVFRPPTRANPLLARLARQIECPIHGTRIIRLAGQRFRADLTDPIAPGLTPDGGIDIAGTMQAVHDVIEGWIREYPEQWLWLHRRWRPDNSEPEVQARGVGAGKGEVRSWWVSLPLSSAMMPPAR